MSELNTVLSTLAECTASFNSSLAVIICNRDGEEAILSSALRLGAIMSNFSLSSGIGGWQGEKVQETEKNILVETWGPNKATAQRVINWSQAYQAEAEQEAISVILRHPSLPGGWQAVIVFDTAGWTALKALAVHLWPNN